MSPAVTKSPPTLVPPASPTPTSTLLLPLSSIDRAANARVSVEFIQVFSRGGDGGAVAAIREGFARALVPYFPVAGRIVESVPGEPMVECSGDGIWFVEAEADCALDDVNQLERPLMIPREELLPRPPPEVKLEEAILMAQVTVFKCGGIAVGICFSHLVFDGQGVAQFMKAVGEMARGLPEPSVVPVWSRNAIPDPPKIPSGGPPPAFTAFNFVTSVIEISSESINRTKNDFAAATGDKCSTFDVVTALYKCRAKAINLPPSAKVHLSITASTRHLLHGMLPSVEGYYGNCVYPVVITRTSEEIDNASIIEIVAMIRDAKEALSTQFVDWINGGTKCNHYNMPLDYGTVALSDWSRLGFNEIDYGWGEPSYVFTLNDDANVIAFAIYLKPPAPKQGIRLMLRCVEEEHSALLCDELLKLA
ncbi:3'-N-debenzoyl-2'-deoxytaxol N-benzoyltransferase [Ananas comosus]|uniref:3'-N-debenzoyl-2'-deoxytaxol N-benzoyltransferase n=1 Tax=Ananas comosus TaxID=4615 RepID=A0A199VZV0_ANACO|nr:3'-N-debenzoyl-2'-deoxytaxol N-benzoyltransferase [Ananas comosus]